MNLLFAFVVGVTVGVMFAGLMVEYVFRKLREDHNGRLNAVERAAEAKRRIW